jgi:hypothetical protein
MAETYIYVIVSTQQPRQQDDLKVRCSGLVDMYTTIVDNGCWTAATTLRLGDYVQNPALDLPRKDGMICVLKSRANCSKIWLGEMNAWR